MKKFFTGLGLLLILEITRTLGSLLFSMFLGPLWVLIIAFAVFSVIFTRCFYHWRFSSGPEKRTYLSSLSPKPEEEETKMKKLVSDVISRTGLRGDVLVSLFVIPLGVYYFSSLRNIFPVSQDSLISFVIILSIAGIFFFALTDAVIWYLVLRKWIINFRETTNNENKRSDL